MDKIELSKHEKQGDTFYTPFTSPSGLGAKLSLSSWAKCWLPEFLWIGLIINKQGRKKGLENIYHIIEELKDEDMVIPQLSKIFGLSAGQQRKYWSIVTRYVEKNILLPLTVVITPDINETFYDFFFDFSMNVDENISELLDIAKENKEKELAQTIVDKSKQVSKLVSRLLLLARIDQNRQKFNKEKVDLSVLVDIAIDGLKELAAQKDILLLTNVPEGMIVNVDEPLLLSAITNLISNGIKYGNHSGYVAVSASKFGNKTEIIVADNGVGISNEHLDKIWGRFYRVDDVRNDEYGSSGLGLAMVKSIIELHGGTISVNSKIGQGTEFRMML